MHTDEPRWIPGNGRRIVSPWRIATPAPKPPTKKSPIPRTAEHLDTCECLECFLTGRYVPELRIGPESEAELAKFEASLASENL